ncbi:MAG: LamG domain-containing protein, partial [Planctomycetota bacterium]
MTTTRKQFTACIIFIITGLLCTSHSNGQVDPKSIVGVWFFDEASGNITRDNSGHGYDADLKEDPAWVEGKFRHALEFQGGSYLEIRNSSKNLPFGGAEPFSITAWVKNQGGGTVIGKFNGGIIGAYILVINDDGTVTFHREVDPWTFTGTKALPDNDFGHVAVTYDGAEMKIYVNGEFDSSQDRGPQNTDTVTPVLIGARFTNNAPSDFFNGVLDEVALFNVALTEEQIRDVMDGLSSPKASNPNPEDGALTTDTWTTLSWSPGDSAVSHDAYMSDNFDDVSDGLGDTFQGNQMETSLIVGFPGFPFPDGLVPGKTYYWRIDEVNDADPNSPWKGNVWSFSVPPKTAYFPDPMDGAEFVDLDATLAWTPGFGAKLHTVYLGDSFEDVNNATGGLPQAFATYTPARPLESEKVYYWRVDEFDVAATHKGDIWSFTTPGAVGNPQPANGAVDVQILTTLNWTPADTAASSDLYFGTDADAVKNATATSPEYMGNKALGSESYDPGKLTLDMTYHWRVDAIYPDKTSKGLVWSFETAGFILVDDFESYNDIDPPDPNSSRIFDKWLDGFGTTTNGALVGNDLPPYAEQTIVHGGAQSMPYFYDNNNKTSEATLTLVYPRDWTEGGTTKLSLWFRGASANAADRMFIALDGTALVYHADDAATQTSRWTEWVIDLTEFAGVDLT